MTKPIIAVTLLLLISCARADDTDTFPGVEKLMSPDEYSESGLDKLGPEERQALNEWLIRYTAWEAPTLRQTNKAVKKADKEFEITARIKQPFTGWSGKTYFYLDDGQVWQQRSSGRYHYSGEDTAVIISKNLLGFHIMTHIANNKRIGVKRIK